MVLIMHEMKWIKWANQIFNTKLNQMSVLLLFGLHNRNGTELGFYISAVCLTNMMRMQTINNNNNNKSNDYVYFAVIWTWSWLHSLILFCFESILFVYTLKFRPVLVLRFILLVWMFCAFFPVFFSSYRHTNPH